MSFQLDRLLSRQLGPDVAAHIRSLRTPSKVTLYGFSTSNGYTHNFEVCVDEVAGDWSLVMADHERSSLVGGVFRDNANERSGVTFERTLPEVGRLAVPDLFKRWGREHESFHPILVQEAAGNLLITFQHEEDAAFRTTMLVSSTDGIARSLIGPDGVIRVDTVEYE